MLIAHNNNIMKKEDGLKWPKKAEKINCKKAKIKVIKLFTQKAFIDGGSFASPEGDDVTTNHFPRFRHY